MILIADSGASKTHWRLIDGERIQQFETLGLHPRFNSKKIKGFGGHKKQL